MSRSIQPGPAVSAGPGTSLAPRTESSTGPAVVHDLPVEPEACATCSCGARESREACRRERVRLEANKLAAERMLQMFDNPVLAHREYNRYVRDLNASIRMHNAVCKPYPITPVSI